MGDRAAVVLVGIGFFIGWGVAFVCSLKILVNSFQEDVVCGLLYLFVPGYALYYLVTRWKENAQPFLISCIAGATALACLACILIAAR